MAEKQLKWEIVQASNSIRKKYREMKRGAVEEEETIKKQFEPLVEPLKTLAKHTERIKSEPNLKEEEDVKEEKEATLSDWNLYLAQRGPRARKYLNGLMWDRDGKFDTKFGVHVDHEQAEWKIGNKLVSFDGEDNVIMDGEKFPGTSGLFQLIFLKSPNSYTREDAMNYKRMLEMSDGHYQEYDRTKRIASSHSEKYNRIISKLFRTVLPEEESEGETSGAGFLEVNNNKIDYVHWNDVNELVRRLAECHAELNAGNRGVAAEIASIEEELREAGEIE